MIFLVTTLFYDLWAMFVIFAWVLSWGFWLLFCFGVDHYLHLAKILFYFGFCFFFQGKSFNM